MSASNYLDIKVNDSGTSRRDFIKSLLAEGWSLGTREKVMYLPLGDNGDYNWQSMESDQNQLFEILSQKELNNEELGIDMTWQNSDSGFELRVGKDGLLAFSLFSSDHRISDEFGPNETRGIIDVGWYLLRIVPAITNIARIEQINWTYIP